MIIQSASIPNDSLLVAMLMVQELLSSSGIGIGIGINIRNELNRPCEYITDSSNSSHEIGLIVYYSTITITITPITTAAIDN
eukprot:Awhi_evm1s2841